MDREAGPTKWAWSYDQASDAAAPGLNYQPDVSQKMTSSTADAGKENSMPAMPSGARAPTNNAGAMQKLAATYDNLQEQLQHLSKREPHGLGLRHAAPPQHASGAAAAAAGEKPQPPPAPAPSLATAPFAPSAPPAQCMTATLLQQQHKHAPTDCILGGSGSGALAPADTLFDFSTGARDSQVLKFAEQLFQDPELLELCDDGLNKQLQRTKDGATEQSRIQELAALVKLLRKCVRELASRSSMCVDQCLKLEKDFLKQVEGLHLQSESLVKSLEAELAGAKKDLAQYEALFKMDKAKWGADLEDQKYEMLRLKRELDRVTEERDRARDGSKRAEQGRQQLEVELKELKKASTQHLREASLSQSEVLQRLTEAAEKRDAALKAAQEDRQRLTKRLDAAQSCIDALQGELAALQAVHDKSADALRTKLSEEDARQGLVLQLQQELEEAKQQLSRASSQGRDLEQQLLEAQGARQHAEGAAQREATRAHALQQELEGVSAALQGERAQWQEERQGLLEDQRQAGCRETALLDEKRLLKTAVTAALGQKEELEAQLAALRREHAVLLSDSANLRNQVDFASGNQQQAEQQVSELRHSLERLAAEMKATQEELLVKDARLQELEGEFSALKEVLGESGQRDVVNQLLHKISTLQGAVAASNTIRRKLHNELVEVKGNIRVYCRVRPYSSGTSCVRVLPDQGSLHISVDTKEHSLEFDRVFGPTATQEEVFSGVSELVQSALDGYHVCLFSYGQTGAGKTYTMQGADTPAGRGIIPRAVEKILETASLLEEQEWQYSMEASFIEIYNNQLRDLLGGPSAAYINDQNAIKHDAAGGHTTVVGISKVAVRDASMASELVQRAAAARSCEATAMNSSSSRSHAVFMLYITGAHAPSGTELQGCLCLVDLAGSERLDRSQAEGQRKAEACAINQSLSSLGDVFGALAAKSSHVPYRNSKLTYLLQPCLGGHGKTLMFVNINPEPASAYESLCSLKFATNVNGCETAAKGGAKRNVVGGASVFAAGAEDDVKRLSLPGFPRMAGSAPEPLAKRMSLAVPSRPGVGAGMGAGMGAGAAKKRLAAPPSSGIPLAHVAKRTKPNA